jgi:hypothetical protein
LTDAIVVPSVLSGDADATVVLVVGDTVVASWPLARAARPDLGLVDELARLQLAASRAGCSIQLCNPPLELIELLELVGLRGVLGGAGLVVEMGGQAEDPEQAGVEEHGQLDDPIA